jgi:hypothetical protein
MKFLKYLGQLFSDLVNGKKNLLKVFSCLILPNAVLIIVSGFFYIRGLDVFLTNLIFFVFIFLLFCSFIAIWKTKGSIIIKIILIFITIITMTFSGKLGGKKDAYEKQIESHMEEGQKKGEKLREQYPDDSPEAIVERHVLGEISKKSNDSEKLQLVSGVFFSFYLSNTNSTIKYCDELGVDLREFEKIFKKNHIEHYKIAEKNLPKSLSVEKLYQMGKSNMDEKIRIDFDNIADSQNIAAKDVCKSIAENAEQIANSTHFSASYPRLNKILLSVSD